MKHLTNCLSALLVTAFASALMAQPPAPPEVTEQHKHLHKELGVWDGTMKMWAPGQEPMEMPLVETNTALPGGLWIESKFDCGPFQGKGTFGYDTQKDKYKGTWVDNMSTHMSIMEGDINDDGELVMHSTGITPDKKEYPIKSVSKFTDDNTRVFTMYGQMPGQDEMAKMFEVTYKKRAEGSK